jgi:hypothetical protein
MEGPFTRSRGEMRKRSVDPPPVEPIRVAGPLYFPVLAIQLVDQFINIVA